MMQGNAWLIGMAGLSYLCILFFLAGWAERQSKKGKSLVKNAWVYALGLAVYCTAWTFYGSVGRATSSGLGFLTTFLGPTLAACFFWPVLHKMIRIAKEQRLTSIPDFISARYGKNFSLALVVSIFLVAGLIPYIALQLKSITDTLQLVLTAENPMGQNRFYTSLGITLLLVLFTILYGARHVDTAEKHEGMVAAIAFDSLFKLLVFVAIGLWISYSVFNGWGDIFERIKAKDPAKLSLLGANPDYFGWSILTLLSGLAMFLLPRQFQMAVIENNAESHVRKAAWLFPLYLLLINLFVLPIAFAGYLLLHDSNLSPDNYVLGIPLLSGQPHWALWVWLGGLAAATGMIVVETIALSNTISNNLVLPLWVGLSPGQPHQIQSSSPIILMIRRCSIGLVLVLALVFSETIGRAYSLVSIGLISFCAVAQLAPALLGGLFWKKATPAGAMAGMLTGIFIWAYTLVLPDIFPAATWVQEGPWGWAWLKPHALLGLEQSDPVVHATIWSLTLNLGIFSFVSLQTKASTLSQIQANLFVDVFEAKSMQAYSNWKGDISVAQLVQTLDKFLGEARAKQLLMGYAHRHQIEIHDNALADGRLVQFTERILGGIVGSASARLMMQSMGQSTTEQLTEILAVLEENQQTIGMNKELKKKTLQLSKATTALEKANTQLKAMDEQKDEFLYTVTHELRTPLTSIRALSEILQDNPDLPDDKKQTYLGAIAKETERLTHLISQVLTLEKYDSGKYRLHLSTVNLVNLLQEVHRNLLPLATEKNLHCQLVLNDAQALVQADPDLLWQVFYNLVSNAIKFANQSVVISLTGDYNGWYCRIQDDGPGIDPSLHQLIFDKFFQAKNQTLRKPEGTGLGLAISKRIADLHGADLWVSSQSGKGACFTLGFPIS